MGPDLPPPPPRPRRIIGTTGTPAPKLMIWYHCTHEGCGVSEAIDAYAGPPLCETGHMPKLMEPTHMIGHEGVE